MRRDLDTALDQCLVWMRDGRSTEDCLASYPEYTSELRSLLELVVDIVHVNTPVSPAAARTWGQERMLAAFATRQQVLAGRPPILRRLGRWLGGLALVQPGSVRPAWQTVALVLVMLALVAGGMTVTASGQTLPGDALYPVKLASQQVWLALTTDPDNYEALSDRFNDQRRQDIQAALEDGHKADIEFYGHIQQIDPGLWQIGGLTVVVLNSTEINGQPTLGALARVQGDLPGDGRLIAVRITIEPGQGPEPTRAPQSTPTLTPTTTRTPTPTSSPTATPTHTPTITTTPTPTATPSSTALPTQTPAPTSSPTATPTPTATLEPTGEPEPTQPPGPTDAPEPTDRPEPTNSPEPPETAEPTSPPEPTDEPESTETPEPPGEPDPTQTPEPTDEPDSSPEPTETEEPESTDEPDSSPEPTETDDPDD